MDSARPLFEESAAAFRRRGDMWVARRSELAGRAIAGGDIDRARRSLEESLGVGRTTGRRRWTGCGAVQLVGVIRLEGHPGWAAGLRTEALDIFRRLGDSQGEAACLALDVPTARRRPRLCAARRIRPNRCGRHADDIGDYVTLSPNSGAVTSVFSSTRQGSVSATKRDHRV